MWKCGREEIENEWRSKIDFYILPIKDLGKVWVSGIPNATPDTQVWIKML